MLSIQHTCYIFILSVSLIRCGPTGVDVSASLIFTPQTLNFGFSEWNCIGREMPQSLWSCSTGTVCMWGINLIKSSHILKWKHLSVDAASPIGIFFWTTLLTRLWDPPTSGCKKVPWPILSGGRLNSKSDSSSCDGICNNIWWHHSCVKYYYSQIISLYFLSVLFILLRGAVTTSVQSFWPSVGQEADLCHGPP